ncbi:hypothetical protein XELAEV_18027542mg [Xenopus laevis]|uniref:Uncharacterized protein n=1 Tax=Xenopus laevis TaxID=8355 RepID=A0A974CWK1_XENLA|nr:hypothetical protein XELAEV_18027542mg [Xenopus laevis]
MYLLLSTRTVHPDYSCPYLYVYAGGIMERQIPSRFHHYNPRGGSDMSNKLWTLLKGCKVETPDPQWLEPVSWQQV